MALVVVLLAGLAAAVPAPAMVGHDPTAPPTRGFVSVAAGDFFTCALVADGTAWCWGDDNFGQLGDGTPAGDPDATTDKAAPSPVDMSGLPAGTRFTALTAGARHACGLAADGTGWCWGWDLFGQLGDGTAPGDAGAKVDKAAPSRVDMSSMPAGSRFTSLTAGVVHTCGVTADGAAWCWGDTFDGQLGDGTAMADGSGNSAKVAPSPVVMPPGVRFTALAAGAFHTCGLAGDGTAYCWGNDDFGQAGNGEPRSDVNTPSPVAMSGMPAGSRFTALTGGNQHTCGVAADGTAWCWGEDFDGQLGDATPNTIKTVPSRVDTTGMPANSRFSTLTAAGFHTCGVTAEGTAWCWGDDDFGQAGDATAAGEPDDTTDKSAPSRVVTTGLPAGSRFTAASGGNVHTCWLTANGTLWCAGDDFDGQLGDATPSGDPDANEAKAVPSAVDMSALPRGTRFISVTAGYAHGCGLTEGGAAWCWGNDFWGQLGDATPPGSPDATTDTAAASPVDTSALPAGARFTALVAGGFHTCGLTREGTAWCWGGDNWGQLGDATPPGDAAARTDKAAPSPVDTSAMPAGTRFTALAAGGNHTCGLTADGTAWCWGSDTVGQLGDATPPGDANANTSKVAPSAVDTSGMPPGGRFAALTGGRYHTCGLSADGTAWCWGHDSLGQLGDATPPGDPNDTTNKVAPSPVDASGMPPGSRFAALAAGGEHTCGRTADGTAWCWGDDRAGQLGDAIQPGDPDATTNKAAPSPVDTSTTPAGSRFTDLTGGGSHTCARTGDGTVWCWGSDAAGQLGDATQPGDPDPTTGKAAPSPVDTSTTPAGSRFTALTGGNEHTCGRTDDGSAWCWGLDGFGSLGDATPPGAPNATTDTNVPSQVFTGVAVTVADVDGDVGETVDLVADASPVGPVAYRWTVDGADVSTSPRLTRTVADGDYTRSFAVAVVNRFASTANGAGRITSTPTVDGGGPYMALPGQQVELRATAADADDAHADPDGPLLIAWDLDEDPDYETAGNPVTTTAPTAPGDHLVGVRVIDDEGRAAFDTATIRVLVPSQPGAVVPIPLPVPVPVAEPDPVRAASVDPDRAEVGVTDLTITIHGSGIPDGSRVTFDRDVTVTGRRRIDSTRMQVTVAIAGDARPGTVSVTVTAPDGRTATCRDCFTITAPPAPTPTPTRPDGAAGEPPAPPFTPDAPADGPTVTSLEGEGDDAVGAAIAWSRHTPAATVRAQRGPVRVLLARDDDFADSLASATAQIALDAPLLLTPTDSLDARTAAELDRLGATSVTILGGPAAIGPAVADALRDAGYTVERIAGVTRTATATATADSVAGSATTAVIARGWADATDATRGWADSVAAGALSGANAPLLLTAADRLSGHTATWLTDHSVTAVTVIGGPAAVSDAVLDDLSALGITATRISGTTRAATATAVDTARGLPAGADAPGGAVLVDARHRFGWADGLPAARHLAATRAGLVLADGGTLPTPTKSWLPGSPRLTCGALTMASACTRAATTARR